MKFNSLLSLFVSLHWVLQGLVSQPLSPVKWSFAHEVTTNGEVVLVFNAAIDQGWHMYGLNMPGEGPIATNFNIIPGNGFSLVGMPTPVRKPVVKYDEILELEVETYSGTIQFKQRVKLDNGQPISIKGSLEYMACDDRTCTPPIEVDFAFDLTTPDIKVVESDPKSIIEKIDPDSTEPKENVKDFTSPVTGHDDGPAKTGDGLKLTFLISILAALGALLTPCVYPMIPMTVSFFMRGSKSRGSAIAGAVFYGFSITLIYTLLGVLVAIFKDPNAVNIVSSHWLVNLIFFLVFLILAASFFGLFELVLPASLANSIDRKADKGGLTGIFFMALGMTILSFSCTGPIVASLLIKASQGDVMEPVLGMFAFGLVFAIPFTLFAIFPSWLKGLPKSGGWLNSVKVFMAFIMLAFSIYFISRIGAAYHLNLISREFYIGFWIVCFCLLGFYMLGKIRFPYDSPMENVSVPRFFVAVAVFSFVLYLVPGLFGADLKALSTLMPPKKGTAVSVTQGARSDIQSVALCGIPKYSSFLSLPHGLQGYFDLEEAAACARERNMPLFIDFAGHNCSNCKKMYASVWSNPIVLNLLSEKFVIVALYTDDRTRLPEDKWYVSEVDGRMKRTIGQMNVDFQIARFNSNALPMYAITDANGKTLTSQPTFTYDLNVENLVSFLHEGLENYSR